MTLLKRVFFRFKALLYGASKRQDLEDELQSHLEMQIEENITSGMSPEEARNAALREFGGVSQIKEECIDSWGVRIASNFWYDVRYGFRQLLKNVNFSIVVILAISIGIGLVTTVFSIVNGFIIRGLPFEESDRLFHLKWDNVDSHAHKSRPELLINAYDLNDFQEQQTTFEGLSGSDNESINIKGDDYARRYNGCSISTNFLELLRVNPLLGRGFLKDEDLPGADPVVIISYGIWQKDFSGVADIIGRSMLLNGLPYTVVGVMPQEFKFPRSAELWFPHHKNLSLVSRKNSDKLTVFGRLKDGVTVDEALTEFNGIAGRLEQEYPESNKGYNSIEIKPYIKEFLGDESSVRLRFLTMLVAAFMVLIIACSNVANLLFSRSILRSKELAIRSAIGAPRKRIITQILTESLLTSIIGTVGGFLIAIVALKFLWNYYAVMIQGVQYPSWINFELDGTVFFFVIGLTVLTGVISGIVPALQVSKTDVNQLLKENARTSSSTHSGRFGKFLVIVQIALSCALLIVSGLMLKSMFKLNEIDLPYNPENIFMASTSLFDTDYPGDLDKITFLKTLQNNLKATPGIEAVAFTTSRFEPMIFYRFIEIDGVSYATEDDYPRAHCAGISSDYFDLLGVSILEGRSFNDTDTAESQQIAIVNTIFANEYWPNQNPIGKRFKVRRPAERPWLTVVGVAPDLTMEGLNTVRSDGSGFYVPMTQETTFVFNITARHMTLLLRGIGGDPMNWLPTVRQELQKLNPNQPIYEIKTVQGSIDNNFRWVKFYFGLFIAFGVIAFLVAVIGVYGVISFSVNQRIHEIGIRKALGAESQKIIAMIIKQSGVQISIGIFIGLLFSLALSRIIYSLFEDMSPHDLTVYIVVITLIALVGLFSAWLPARVAARVDPVMTIRNE